MANRFFRKPLTVADIVWRFAGVRPLDEDGSDDPASVTRDYRLDLNAGPPAMLHVIGGKITTYRRLAEAGLDKLAPHLSPMGPAWTAGAPLPGGDVGERGFEAWLSTFQDRHPGFDPADLARLARRYGTRLGKVIGDAQNLRDLGADLGGGLSQREVAYLAREEWARRPEDVLWRRTKAGLRIPAAAREAASERILAVLERA